MQFSAQEIELALQYAEMTDFHAYLNPEDQGQVLFQRTPLPEGIGEEMKEEIDFVADYYQRQIFNGDLDPDDPEPGWPEFDHPLDEINFKLKRFQSEFVTELRKSLGVEKHRQINPFARVMMEYQADHADYSKFGGKVLRDKDNSEESK